MSISVVIPCHNHGRYLDEALDSVFAQTVQDFEIVIVNDGSTDRETNEMLSRVGRPRTRVVTIENRGLPGARNAGIRETTRPLICALDADDVLEPTWFERALEVLDAEPDVSFVSHWLRTFGDETWEWTPERCDLVSLLDRNTINGAAVVRRAAIEAVGLFDESMRHGCEDWDLWIRMVEQGHRGVIVPEFLFRYRRRSDSMSRAMNRPAVQLDLFRQLIEKHGESYRAHLLDLLQRRATNLCDLRGEMWDLEREYREWWAPEIERRRSEVSLLRRKVKELRDEQEREAELAELRERRTHLEADLDGHRKALANASAEIDELRALQDRRGHEIEALQASWSWRLTAPLRAVAGWLTKRGGDR